VNTVSITQASPGIDNISNQALINFTMIPSTTKKEEVEGEGFGYLKEDNQYPN
jgi:hypothetical protein